MSRVSVRRRPRANKCAAVRRRPGVDDAHTRTHTRARSWQPPLSRSGRVRCRRGPAVPFRFVKCWLIVQTQAERDSLQAACLPLVRRRSERRLAPALTRRASFSTAALKSSSASTHRTTPNCGNCGANARRPDRVASTRPFSSSLLVCCRSRRARAVSSWRRRVPSATTTNRSLAQTAGDVVLCSTRVSAQEADSERDAAQSAQLAVAQVRFFVRLARFFSPRKQNTTQHHKTPQNETAEAASRAVRTRVGAGDEQDQRRRGRRFGASDRRRFGDASRFSCLLVVVRCSHSIFDAAQAHQRHAQLLDEARTLCVGVALLAFTLAHR